MKKKPKQTAGRIARPRAVTEELPPRDLDRHLPMLADFRRRAEKSLRAQRRQRRLKDGESVSNSDLQRTLHELEVHQIELELQNLELQRARDELEQLLEQYTDLYDFAPAGYFSLDEAGTIMQANLAGAALLGVERSQLTGRRLAGFVAPASRPGLLAFLKQVFAATGKQICEVEFLKPRSPKFWASIHGVAALATNEPKKWCRLVVSDLTSFKEAQETKRRLEGITVANRELTREITRRRAVEEALKESEQHQKQLLDESIQMHEKLRKLSRQILRAQEDERRKISRELHDVIAQILTGIDVRLTTLKREAGLNRAGFERNLEKTRRLVAKSVNIVQQFARELRPAVLDDLGLIPALHSYVKTITRRTPLEVHLKCPAEIGRLSGEQRTTLYRVAQEALTNVARHARAGHVEVAIRQLPGRIRMTIKDDGRSFDVDDALQRNHGKHLGLLGMRERLEMAGGDFRVVSVRGQGTVVEAQIPLRNPRGGGLRTEPTTIKSKLS